MGERGHVSFVFGKGDYLESYYHSQLFLSYPPEGYQFKFYPEVLIFTIKLCLNHFDNKTKEALKLANMLQIFKEKRSKSSSCSVH